MNLQELWDSEIKPVVGKIGWASLDNRFIFIASKKGFAMKDIRRFIEERPKEIKTKKKE
jgi:predicted metal-dependent phosphotriesterase family hydrolase